MFSDISSPKELAIVQCSKLGTAYESRSSIGFEISLLVQAATSSSADDNSIQAKDVMKTTDGNS